MYCLGKDLFSHIFCKNSADRSYIQVQRFIFPLLLILPTLLMAQSLSVLNPLSVCFNPIYQTQLQTSSDIDARSAALLSSNETNAGGTSQRVAGGGQYGVIKANVDVSSASSYNNNLSKLNSTSYSDRELHNYMMKSLTPAAIDSMNLCMDTVAKSRQGSVTVWPQVTSDPRRVIVNVQFVSSGSVPSMKASIKLSDPLAKSNGKINCEKCSVLSFGGDSVQDFILQRDDPRDRILAVVNAGNEDKSIDIDSYRELHFIQPPNVSSGCLTDLPHIIRIIAPQDGDARSKAKDTHFAPAVFPSEGFSGIAYLVEPMQTNFPADPLNLLLSNLVLQDHKPANSVVPDAADATIVYEFDSQVAVAQLEIIQHTNGVSSLHAWLADTLDDLDKGDLGEAVRPWPQGIAIIPEGQSDVFVFPVNAHAMYGRFLKVTFTRTVCPCGWAMYRMFPRDKFGSRILPAAKCTDGVPSY